MRKSGKSDAVITPPKAAEKEILHERKHDQGPWGGVKCGET